MKELALKLAALFSYCGGPLFVAELLKPRFDHDAVFMITFAPVALMLVGALSLGYQPGDRLAAFAVSLGRQGVYVTLGMHAYALMRFVGGTRMADQGLYLFGIAIGVVWSVFYLRAARRGAAIHRAGERDPASAKPIEPS